MKDLTQRCMAQIRSKSVKYKTEGYYAQDPANPSIIVNYNLDNEKINSYYGFLEYLWPKVDINIPRADKDSNFEEIINKLRANSVFENFNVINIHILVNLTNCNPEDLYGFVKAEFESPVYKIIFHEFLDYTKQADIEATEKKLLTLMKNRVKTQYQFIYSNKLNNGAMWIGESASKILRLAADITAVMVINSHYFNNGNTYTFSYNLLEKPTKKIIQFTIRRLLEKLCDGSDFLELDQSISKKYIGLIRKEAIGKSNAYIFNEDSFKYLPDNKKLYKEKPNIKKGIETLRRNYPVTESCFMAMVNQKIDEVKKIKLEGVDFSKDLADPILSFFSVKGFLKNGKKKEELLDCLKKDLSHKKHLDDEGSYSKILTEYANNTIELETVKKVFDIFLKQCMERIEHALSVNDWLSQSLEDSELQINSINNEKNFIEHYGGLIDDYFITHKDEIIAKLDLCNTKEELLSEQGLHSVLSKMFNEVPIYFKSFEDEIDERVGADTAKKMFGNINNPDSVNRNICIDWTNLQFDLNKTQTNDVLLLINPDSRLLNLDIDDNYELWELNRQDCVERIDFHVLSLKQEEEWKSDI